MRQLVANNSFIRRILYFLTVALIFVSAFGTDRFFRSIICCVILLAFLAMDELLFMLGYDDTPYLYPRYCFIKITMVGLVAVDEIGDKLVFTGIILLCMYCIFDYLLVDAFYDKGNLVYRKITLVFPLFLCGIVAFSKFDSTLDGFSFIIAMVVLFITVVYFINNFMALDDKHTIEKNELRLEIGEIEKNNEKLIEYQNKIKLINEEINFQRIDLARTNKELEQANIEIESQTEVMKSMASTFNVYKCMNVIAESIMDVKKPKLCAIYIKDEQLTGKHSSCIIKTNYTSVEARLNKEIDKIFDVFESKKKNSTIYKDEGIKFFKFVGETNINSIAILPIIDAYTTIGILIVASDKDNFFDNGLAYYETSMVEFDTSIKSIKLYLKMQDMARKDGLTGIYNRIYFTELFKEVATEAREKKKILSVALFDIDKFKNVNDTYGHLAGDEVIKMVASTGQKYAEKYNGFTCRFGGEEFLLVLPDKDEHFTLSVLEEMHDEIRNTIVHAADADIEVNVCIGLTSYPNLCDNPDLLISRADKAMYYGKRNGRGRLVVDNPSINEELEDIKE